MKHLKTVLTVMIVTLAMGLSSIASAQYPAPRLNTFLDQHPKTKEKLARNPDLIFNKGFRRDHPELQGFMQDHPDIWGKLRNNGHWGAYGPDHQWHEADWWHDHDRGWMYENHPEWAENHPDWRGDGDFDENHDWHDRGWWNDHHPDWVEKHHANWHKQQEHEAAKEEQHEEKVHWQEVEQQSSEHRQGHHGNKGDHDHN
jgi:hypothetical protein